MNQSQSGLKKELKTRHMTMISIAGVIGAGLFVGSGSVIHSTGPGAVVSYALAGLLVIFIMRMLGEMSAVNPTSGSFSQYAHDAIGPWAGFTIGWLYWFFWVIVIAIEAIAGAGIIQYWFHDIPLWLTSLILTIVLTLTNVYSVKSFGEFEYWFSLIKVVTIIAFLIIGFAFIFGFAPGSEPVGLSNLTGKGGFFPEGISSVLLGIVVVIFSFMGTEIVAIAAGETSNPIESVTKATRSVVWRIIVFYVGSIAIVVALLPWNSANILESPFVAVLEHIGVPAAAQIMNFIVLTAVLSCLNSGLYTTSRMLYSLAERNEAPRRFMKLSKKGVPVQAIVAGTFFSYIAVVMNYFSPDTVFLFLVNSSGAIALLVYLVIAVSQLKMRKKLEKTNPEALKIKMWLFPFLTYLTIIAICGILVSMAFIDSMRDELLLTGVITGIVLISYLVFRKRKVSEKAAANPVTQQQPDILP
ncbi:GABA permease [Bacillus subtilis]|uniref:GABA permease n=1 Tax=Bacillus subtilis TaxID=1423 RepID=UPI0002B401B4|nr:GABA permease [Bacillus subtilis]AGE62494.1 gamma-aminobutyrate (GABA) permease [Bacillus subtilis XF-1]AGI27891.1 gamma-aminobutyrate (GABA) permease [Bacillus subtilis subsp. subtilis str. BAB-1]AKD34023.1 gamma-aminobutyrate permease [Bacillus subtilis HJ5]ALS83198.1 GABA permease [Bacillus subtilis subsp. subtilis]ASK22623.1 gamma-aminobutyrate (GABA) permease [Bacillus subtilis]